MSVSRNASVVWNGNLLEGQGQVSFDSSNIGTFSVSWPARSQEPNGMTSPEELIAAAHASCFSMALSNGLAKAGTPPTTLHTQAKVDFTPGVGITGIALSVQGQVPGITAEMFAEAAQTAKANCPVSQALAAVPITLAAALMSSD